MAKEEIVLKTNSCDIRIATNGTQIYAEPSALRPYVLAMKYKLREFANHKFLASSIVISPSRLDDTLR